MENISAHHVELTGLFLGLLLFTFSASFREFFRFTDQPARNTGISRSTAVDFVRGISMIAIVIIHVDSYFEYYHPKDSIIYFTHFMANISRFCVPAFILSSAFFISYKGTSADFWIPKIRHLILPYLLIASIGYFTKYPVGENFTYDFFFRLLSGKIFTPYYFIFLLLEFYLFYAFFLRFFEKNRWAMLVLLGISIPVNYVSNIYVTGSNTPWIDALCVSSLTGFIFFFFIGMSSKNIFKDQIRFEKLLADDSIFRVFLPVTVIIYLVVVAFVSFSARIDLSNHFLFYPLVIFILLYRAGLKIERSSNTLLKNAYKGTTYLGEKSLAIFLIHPAVIHLMHNFDPFYPLGAIAGWLIGIVLNIVIPLLIWELAGRIIRQFGREK
ncbi:MAG: acyltransferase [Leptospira sp.]|nr:acyltransferase [Leptospira sp.]